MTHDRDDHRIDVPRLGGNPEREMDQEIDAHLAMRIDDLVRAGMTPQAAQAEAERRFGDLRQARQQLHAAARRRDSAVRHRDWFAGVAGDLRFAMRQIRRSTVQSAIAVAILAIGIGLTGAMFTLVERVILRPLPFPQSERLVQVTGLDSLRQDPQVSSMGDWQDWRSGARTLAGTALFSLPKRLGVVAADSATRVTYEEVAGEFFGVLRPRFLLGRGFTGAEGQATTPVTVVSERVWRDFLGATRSLPAKLTLGDRRFGVIGVVAAGSEFPVGTDVWVPVPVRPEAGAMRNNIGWIAVARLATGVTPAMATLDLDRVSREIRARDRAGLYDFSVKVSPLQEMVVGDAPASLRLLMASVAFVLLIICANLAVATLGRGAAREQEMAVRASLGASRGRLITQMLIEHLTLALAGGLAGVAVAWGSIRLLVSVWGDQIPRSPEIRLDWRVVAFMAVTSLVVGVLAGIVPALRGSRASLQMVMKQGGRTSIRGSNVAGTTLVVVEFAASLLLLVGAGLLIRSFRALLGRDLGFDPQVATAELVLSGTRYGADSVERLATWDRLIEAYRSIPSVESVALANWIPLGIAGSSFIDVEGNDRPNAGAGYRVVSEDFFRTMGIRMLAGRSFNRDDGLNAPGVTVINRAMAERYWPGQDPIGKRLRARIGYRAGADVPWLTVVGVVGDVRQWGLELPPRAEMYAYFRQRLSWSSTMTAVIRGRLPANRLVPLIRSRTRVVDPLLAADAGTMEERVAAEVAPRRLTMSVLAAFAALALLLAALGVYGVLSFAVTQRARELAMRSALGAQPGHLLVLVLWSGFRTVAIGVTIGVAGAVALSRVLGAMLVDLSPLDVPTYAGSVLVLGIVALVAIMIPAIRATRLDPMTVLRAE